MSKKKNRGQLYDKFRRGSIPTGADFADLIRSGVNFVDDGMDIPETDALLPIKIRGRSEYNHIFDFCDNQWNLQWRLSQVSNDEQVSETTRHGLNFSSNSTSRLFIEQEFGNLGLSNEEPQARLHIRQLGSQDCFRIDDEASDLSPFIIDSTGALGLGTLSPQAVFHLTNSSVNDSVRIDDQSSDDTPFVIQKDGNVGIGYDSTNVKVAINGGLNVGNTNDPGDKNASIQGNLHVHTDTQLGDDDQHKVVMPAKLQSVETPNASSKVEINDSLQINENLTVKKNVLLEGTLTVNGDVITKDTEHVLGNVILGDEDSDTITVTGTMISGHSSGKLEINDAVNIKQSLEVLGNVNLGNNDADIITIQGSLKSGHSSGKLEIDDAVNIKQTLEVVESLKLSGSTQINEFSTDTSLNGNSDTALPTEKAVKSYVDQTSTSLQTNIDGTLPIGAIIMWHGSSTPLGWLLCDGSSGTPDLRDRFIVGAGKDYSLGNIGGKDKVTLTEAEMPQHTHIGDISLDGSHTHDLSVKRGSHENNHGVHNFTSHTAWADYTNAKISGGSHTHTIDIKEAGSTVSHENRPPYFALSFIMKIS